MHLPPEAVKISFSNLKWLIIPLCGEETEGWGCGLEVNCLPGMLQDLGMVPNIENIFQVSFRFRFLFFVACAYSLSIGEAEAGVFWVEGQPELKSESLFQKKQTKPGFDRLNDFPRFDI